VNPSLYLNNITPFWELRDFNPHPAQHPSLLMDLHVGKTYPAQFSMQSRRQLQDIAQIRVLHHAIRIAL
jgi:hypothetical protein